MSLGRAGGSRASSANLFVISAIMGYWRRGWDSNPRYAFAHNGFLETPRSTALAHLRARFLAVRARTLEPKRLAAQGD